MDGRGGRDVEETHGHLPGDERGRPRERREGVRLGWLRFLSRPEGTKGTSGPNLDQTKPGYAKTVDLVTNGAPAMVAYKGSLSTKQIQDVAAFVDDST